MDQQTPNTPATPPQKSGSGIGIAAAVIIIIAIAVFALMRGGKNDAELAGTGQNNTQQAADDGQQTVPPADTATGQQPTATPTPTPSPTPPPSTGGSAQTVSFSVEGGMFYFKPNTITAKKGDTVKITFNNKEGFHDFVIDEFAGARTKQIQAGQTETISFVVDKTGTFEFYCSVGQHRQMGMKGTLVVQ